MYSKEFEDAIAFDDGYLNKLSKSLSCHFCTSRQSCYTFDQYLRLDAYRSVMVNTGDLLFNFYTIYKTKLPDIDFKTGCCPAIGVMIHIDILRVKK